MKRADYHIMSQTVVNTEPLNWPIAPDGYIPNSVIRSWRKGGKGLSQTDCWNDIFFYSFHDEPNDQEDASTRIFWFLQDEEEEEEKTGDKKEKEDEKNKKKEDKTDVKGKAEKAEKDVKENRKTMEMGGKDMAGEKKEDMMDQTDLKQCHSIQAKTGLQHHLRTFDDGKLMPQRQEVGSTYSSRKAVNFPPTPAHENGPKQLRELREDMQCGETITSPLQYLSVPNKLRASSFIPKEWPEPSAQSPVVSADTFIPKQESRFTTHLPPTEPQNWTAHPQECAPPIPKDPQPQQIHGPLECAPTRDETFLLSFAKYDNIRDQAYVPLDRKVLEHYKKSKVCKNNLSHHGKLSTTAERPPISRVRRSTIQNNTGRLGLDGGLSTIQTQHLWNIHPECLNHLLCPDYPAQFAQTISSIKDQKLMPEWRKNLYKLISLQGFRSPRGAKFAATEHPVKPSSTSQLAASIPSVQPGQVAAHQRVVERIQIKDTLELASSNFHHVIPMASQHSYFTLDPCGKTQYGKLQFDWMRGCEEAKLLKVSAV